MEMRLVLPVLLALAGCGAKEGPACDVPDVLPRPMLEGPTRDEPRRLLPIASYTLAISWSPQYCANRATSPADRLQCGGQVGDFGFTLHGLWPDGAGAQWPQYCRPTRLVPEKVVRQALCSTPSVQLIQHEWEKHGTCMARAPADYFAKSLPLYGALKYPDMAALREKPLTSIAFRRAFANANEGMTAEQMRLKVDRQGWLEEVWICLDKRFQRTRCTGGQADRSPNRRIRIR